MSPSHLILPFEQCSFSQCEAKSEEKFVDIRPNLCKRSKPRCNIMLALCCAQRFDKVHHSGSFPIPRMSRLVWSLLWMFVVRNARTLNSRFDCPKMLFLTFSVSLIQLMLNDRLNVLHINHDSIKTFSMRERVRHSLNTSHCCRYTSTYACLLWCIKFTI